MRTPSFIFLSLLLTACGSSQEVDGDANAAVEEANQGVETPEMPDKKAMSGDVAMPDKKAMADEADKAAAKAEEMAKGAMQKPEMEAAADPGSMVGVVALEAMRADIAAMQASDELPVDGVTVKHILIGFTGAPRMGNLGRDKQQAEQLASEIYAQLKAGGDFDALQKEHSNDPGPGPYPMTQQTRRGLVPGFGQVGFRLEVGAIGVAPHHGQNSPYGWHIIQRTE